MSRCRSLLKFTLLVVLSALALAPALHATPLVGVLNITGSARVTLTETDFLPLGGGEGDFAIDLFTQAGFFTTLAGTTGDIGDLNTTDHPPGSPLSVPLWMTFDANPLASFTLTFVHLGVFSAADCFAAPAAGQTCTLPGSAFNLSNTTASSSVATFQVSGNAIGTEGEVTPFTGTFSTQFVDMPFQDVLTTITGGGFVEATYSANFLVIPEPGALHLVLGGGLLLLAAGLRRRFR